jgi:hypothetical protein
VERRVEALAGKYAVHPGPCGEENLLRDLARALGVPDDDGSWMSLFLAVRDKDAEIARLKQIATSSADAELAWRNKTERAEAETAREKRGREDAIADLIKTEAEAARYRAALCAPWSCPECGDHVMVDEDGCCATCGRDAALAPQEGDRDGG